MDRGRQHMVLPDFGTLESEPLEYNYDDKDCTV